MTYSYATMPLPFFGLLLICDIPLRRPPGRTGAFENVQSKSIYGR